MAHSGSWYPRAEAIRRCLFINQNINPEGDPCETLLPPIGHWLQTNTVFTLTNDNITGDCDQNYLNIIVIKFAITNTLYDGCQIKTNSFVEVGKSGCYGAQIQVTNGGVHTVTSSQPVNVEVYGFGPADAYGYTAGVVK